MSNYSREDRESLAAAIGAINPSAPEGYFARLSALLHSQGVELPEVSISYKNLNVVADATDSAASLPSLPNVLTSFAKAAFCQRAATEPLTILNNLTGTLEPARLTLLLGPPSCGKTTFLKALAGRLKASEYSGEITANSHTFDEFSAARSIAFVAQSDTHIANLTARETAQFAFDSQHGPRNSLFRAGEQAKVRGGATDVKVDSLQPSAALKDMSVDELRQLTDEMLDGGGRVDTIMEFLGLKRCKDTVVGNAMLRGVSGGERKRLSTVEMLMGGQRVLVLDEISTGLDAATLYNVIRWLSTMTHNLKLTTIVSLLQPPPETFSLFDDLMIMNKGTIVFHGAIKEATPFMASLGFDLPPRKDVPSFLQEATTVRGQVVYASVDRKAASRIPPDLDPTDEVAMADLELLISLEDMAAAPGAQRQAASKASKSAPGGGALVPLNEKFTLSFFPMLSLVLKRQRMLFVRDPTLVRARLAQCAIMGLLIGGLWFGLDVNAENARTFMSSTFIIVMFVGFGGMPQLAVALQNRAVWFKQRDCNMYTAMSYAWSQAIVQIPLSFLEALIFAVIVYFMIGFSTDGPEYFFIFYAVLISASIAITSIFRMIGAIFQEPALANACGGFLLLMLIVNSGFIIVRSAIPPWVVWFYYLSPFAYSVRALAINELTSPRWDMPSPVPGKTLGVVSLEQLDFYTERKWIWFGILFNVGLFFVLTQLTALFLSVLSLPKKAVVMMKAEELKRALERARQTREEAEARFNDNPVYKTDPAAALPPGQMVSSRREGTSTRNNLSVGSSLAFTPISVVWRHLCYYVTVPAGLTGAAALNVMPKSAEADVAGKKRLLNDVTGFAMPGVLTALMGGSGAGKTTLMDVLAGRKTQGVIKGELLVNGHPKVQDTWARVVGYVEQTDVHSAGLTVEESLQFSAGLRLSADVGPSMRDAYVLEVLLVTELLDIKGNLVGEPGVTGLSVEQRRRLSIGVELVANPSVMFLDEPTSGLDANSASAVIAAVRNVAANGRTVMVTIHQPSIEIFEAFDRLVLLGMGGEPIFCGDLGPESKHLVSHFQSVPGVTPLPEGYNPATWMLEVSGGGAKMKTEAVEADFPAIYQASALCKAENEEAEAIAAKAKAGHEPLALSSQYAVGTLRQVQMVTWKMFVVYWRYPYYTVGRLCVTVITALIFGMTWWDEGTLPDDRPATLANIQNIIGSLYSGLSFMGMTNLISGVPAFLAERQVMYRERASSMYAVLPFGIATGLVEMPYLLVQAFIFVPIVYFMIGFTPEVEPFFLFVLVFMESITLYTFMGQLFVYLTPSAPVATLLGGLNHFLWNIFNGFLVPTPIMAKGFVWLNYISATTYVIYGLAASQLGAKEQLIIVPGYAQCTTETQVGCPTVKEFISDYFGYDYSFRWWCALILFAFIMVFRVAAMITLKLINHQHR